MSSNQILNIDDIVRDVVNANPNDASFNIQNILYAGKTTEVSKVIDQLFIQSGFGAVKSGITRNLYGVNFAGTPNMLPINRDSYGLTFFTKPTMNMTTANLRQSRIMSQLLNRDANSIHRLIRCSLDAGIYKLDYAAAGAAYSSPFINPKSPFIPVLSNNLLSMSGWPDMDSQTYTSSAGNWREEYSFIDGIIKDFRVWDTSCSFKNMDGNIIVCMFFYWLMYQASVAAVGDLRPYPISILSHEVDYNTAIYRFTLDGERDYITGGARTIAYPLTCPIGAQFNFDSEQVYNDENRQVSIQFRCHGAEYVDDIIIDEFNRLVELVDPDFRGQTREQRYVRIPKGLWRFFNGLAQPRINPDTYQFEWYVSTEDYMHHVPALQQQIMSTGHWQSLTEQTKQLNPKTEALRRISEPSYSKPIWEQQ